MILTAFTSWFVTRRRSKYFEEFGEEGTRFDGSEIGLQLGLNKTMSFNDSRDMLSTLKIEVAGAESSLKKLAKEKELGEISGEAFNYLNERYNNHVNEISNKMNEMIKSSIQASTGEIDEGIDIDHRLSDEDMADIEADLQKQLLDLEADDDFLKPTHRAKTPISEVYKESPKEVVTPPVKPTEALPVAPAPSKVASKAPAPMPAPPTKTSVEAPAPPSGKVVQPAEIPAPGKVKIPPRKAKTAPAPVAPPPKKVAPAPVAPPKQKIPPPPAKSEKLKIPPSQQPSAISAQQPMKVQSQDEDEKIFAKSTSIAALRMDMLRELARLKKLISDDDK